MINSKNAKKYLPLIKALSEGKTIQAESRGQWFDMVGNISFNIPYHRYRIKPDGKEIWVNRFPNGSESGAYSTKQEAAESWFGRYAIQVRYREVTE